MDQDQDKMNVTEQVPGMPLKKNPKELTPATRLTSEYLEQQTRDFLEAFNSRDFDMLYNKGSNQVDHDRFTGTIANHAPALSWREHIDVYRHMAHAEPNLKLNIIQIDSNIKAGEGTAELYVFAEATGKSGGVRTQGVSNLSWRQKRGGEWLCTKHVIFQGIGDVL